MGTWGDWRRGPLTYFLDDAISAQAFTAAARSGGAERSKVRATRGLDFNPLGLSSPGYGSAGPNWPDGIRRRACVRYAVPLGPPRSSDDEEAVGAGFRILTAASLAQIWRGSSSTLMRASTLTSTVSVSSTTNSTERASDSRTSLFTGLSGARGQTASASRDRRGGRKDDWRGGAEQ